MDRDEVGGVGEESETTPSPMDPLLARRRPRRNSMDQQQQRRHHRRFSSPMTQFFSSFSDSVASGLETIVEDVQDTAVEVRAAFLQKLHDADEGQTYFLETSMTRSLSILPEALPALVEETTGIVPAEEPTAPRGIAVVTPYFSLLGAVLAVSSTGTAMSLLKGVNPSMKLYWRMTAVALFLSAFALKSIRTEGWPKLTVSQWTTFGCAVVAFSAHTIFYFYALNYTSIGNAVIYANSQALLLLMGKIFVGEPVVLMEGSGAILAFSGAILCSTDSEGGSSSSNEESGWLAIFGDVLALCSAICGVGYLTFAKAVRPYMSVTLFMFLVMLCGSFLVLAFMAIAGVTMKFSNDPYVGLFGWVNWNRPDRLLLEVWVVVVCNMVGTMGFVRAMQHFENIIIAVATLMEPMVASFIAYGMQVGDLPGPLGWVGNVMVAIGTLGVVYPSVNKGGGGH